MIDKFRSHFYFLSNFYPVPITLDGVTYPTAEHAFQAQKDLTRRHDFTTGSPSDAKRLGRRVRLRADWQEVKDDLMYEIVRAKFAQHPDLTERLLKTGDNPLIEGNTWGDTYWGVCNGKGKNVLGNILMRVRDDLRG